jgi:hypothetical protein
MEVIGQMYTPGVLAPEEIPVPIGEEAGWTPESSGRNGEEKKSFASAGNRAPVVQSVAK